LEEVKFLLKHAPLDKRKKQVNETRDPVLMFLHFFF